MFFKKIGWLSNSSRVVALLGAALVAGCAIYRPLPIPINDGLKTDAESLLRGIPVGNTVDVNDGMDMTELAVVAVVTNPDLNATRRRFDVAHAQLFSTRLLPDPQFNFGVDHPTNNGPGLNDARNVTLNYDVLALLTRASSVNAQALSAKQIQLEIVWQEWQVSQQARLLFVRERSEVQKVALLQSAVENFQRRQRSSAKALQDGNLTIENAGPDLAALLDAGSQAYQVQQQHNQTAHELRALLGLMPGAELNLSGLPPAPVSRPIDVTAIMPSVIATRPDLLALQAGYASQEANVRKSTLRFFPALTLGLARAVDTSNVYTSGLSLSLDLPVFAGNRGEVRIERATRDLLRTEYLARLAQTHSDISRLVSEQAILDARREFLGRYIPELERMVTEARRAYGNQDIDALVYLNIEFALIGKHIELVDLEQALWEIAIALDTIAARAPT